jgi:glucosamine--fructose-6-phosphate aminotransferase (isomerizing)
MEKEIFEQSGALKQCLSYNENSLNNLAKLVQKGGYKGIVVAARGSSDNAGNYFKYVAESLIGLPVSFAAPSVNTIYGSKLNYDGYIVIGISQSGAAEDVMAVLQNAKDSGALTISVTNNLQSKMCAMTDFHLYCNCGEEKSVAATKTFLAQMYLLGQLAARIAQKERLISDLSNLSEGIEKVLALNGEIKQLSAKYADTQAFIVLARGLSYAIAQEASLKLQETCYINARPYAISDFAHGPFALVDGNTRVILIAPSGSAYFDTLNMKNKLLEAGAQILIITDDKQAAKGCAEKIMLPQIENEYLAPFYIAVAAQLFACNLSLNRGLNPDAPRGLKKVTITK